MANINENDDSGRVNINRGIKTESLTLLAQLDKDIILKHLQLAGELNKWFNIRIFLIEEMRKKKCLFKRKLYHPIDPQAKPYYDYILFDNSKGNSTLNPFPVNYKAN